MYAGKETVDIWDGVRRGRLVRLAVGGLAGVVVVPLTVPASCSAVISLTSVVDAAIGGLTTPVPKDILLMPAEKYLRHDLR